MLPSEPAIEGMHLKDRRQHCPAFGSCIRAVLKQPMAWPATSGQPALRASRRKAPLRHSKLRQSSKVCPGHVCVGKHANDSFPAAGRGLSKARECLPGGGMDAAMPRDQSLPISPGPDGAMRPKKKFSPGPPPPSGTCTSQESSLASKRASRPARSLLVRSTLHSGTPGALRALSSPRTALGASTFCPS